MKELWTAQVHLLTSPVENGDTRCFTYVVAWAENAEDFASYISTVFARRHWSVLGVRHCMRADECMDQTAELSEQIERAKMGPDTCIFGICCYYPSRIA